MSAWIRSKKAKFFCEHCGYEVPSKAKVCTHCGRFFSSVKCPKCGRVGRAEEFIHGCPDCGYAMKKKTQGIQYTNTKKHVDSALPTWVYFFTLIVLVVLVICLYSCL